MSNMSYWRKARQIGNGVDAATEEDLHEGARSDPDAQPTDSEWGKNATLVVPMTKQAVSHRLGQNLLEWSRNQGGGFGPA